MTAIAQNETFGNVLRRLREQEGLSVRDIAERCGIGVAVVKAWERDEAVPAGREFARLTNMALRQLRHYEHLLKTPESKGKFKMADVVRIRHKEAPKQTEMPLETTPEPQSFGEALKIMREAEKLSRSEVARLLNISHGAVLQWEHGKTKPSAQHLEHLGDLFPTLRASSTWPTYAKPMPLREIPAAEATLPVEEPVKEVKEAPVVQEVPFSAAERAGIALARARMARKAAQAALEEAHREVVRLEVAFQEAGKAVDEALKALEDAT